MSSTLPTARRHLCTELIRTTAGTCRLGCGAETFHGQLSTDSGKARAPLSGVHQHRPDATEEMAFARRACGKFGMGSGTATAITRQCMATAVVAYKEAFGFDAPSYTLRRLSKNRYAMVFCGSNPCIAHPIMWERVMRNRRSRRSSSLIHAAMKRRCTPPSIWPSSPKPIRHSFTAWPASHRTRPD